MSAMVSAKDGIGVDLTKLLRESSDLAQAGCRFDEEGKLAPAIKAYDEAIILMDSVLTEIPPTEDAWKVLLELRSQYSNRLVCSVQFVLWYYRQ